MTYKCNLVIHCFHGNNPFAFLKKIIELPFIPYPELDIALHRRKSTDAQEDEVYVELLSNTSDPTGIVNVEDVTYYLDRPDTDYVFRVGCRSVVDKDVNRLNNFVKLMERFHGFKVEMA